jgi:hypothetical protein
VTAANRTQAPAELRARFQVGRAGFDAAGLQRMPGD